MQEKKKILAVDGKQEINKSFEWPYFWSANSGTAKVGMSFFTSLSKGIPSAISSLYFEILYPPDRPLKAELYRLTLIIASCKKLKDSIILLLTSPHHSQEGVTTKHMSVVPLAMEFM